MSKDLGEGNFLYRKNNKTKTDVLTMYFVSLICYSSFNIFYISSWFYLLFLYKFYQSFHQLHPMSIVVSVPDIGIWEFSTQKLTSEKVLVRFSVRHEEPLESLDKRNKTRTGQREERLNHGSSFRLWVPIDQWGHSDTSHGTLCDSVLFGSLLRHPLGYYWLLGSSSVTGLTDVLPRRCSGPCTRTSKLTSKS